ncbi:MAG: HAMP domain-containing protein [bacterium]|nr:MAG: HAMP domain-containing protein [bacterium]
MNSQVDKSVPDRLPIFHFSRLKLQGKFFIYFTGLVLLVVIFIAAAVIYFHKQLLLQQAQEKAISLTRTLAYTSLNAVLQDDYLVLQSLIDSMIDGPDIVSIAVVDSTGCIIAASQPELRGDRLNDPFTMNALLSDRLLLQKEVSQEGQEIWDTAVPIFNLNKRIGLARMKYSLDDPLRGLIQSVLVISVVAVLLSLLLAYRFSTSISRPMKQAVELASEYGKGNLNVSIDMVRRDEIGELVESLNKLSKQLKSLIDEKIANENLVMMGEFASYIIHDLKNPLSGIHLLSDGLHRKIEPNSPLKKYATEILLASQKLHDFVERTLDISRWNRVNLIQLDIREVIEKAIQELDGKEIPILQELESDIPKINADYQMMLMVIKNLITNATEAIDGKGHIWVRMKWMDGQILIEIKDDGCGIPDEKIETIFRPFFSMKRQGHGLGLAMVRKAVMLHQGKISVQSKVGEGSIFTILLPGDLKST